MEGAGAAPSPVRSDLRAAALLRADADPHLPALPGPGLYAGAAAELVRDVDASVGVSNGSPSIRTSAEFCRVSKLLPALKTGLLESSQKF